MLKNEIAETTETESAQDQVELNEGDLDEVAGGLNYTKTSKPAPGALVDYF